MITPKWLKDKCATLEGEIQALQRRGAQLQQALSRASTALLIKQGELSAIEEVAQELERKKEVKETK